MLRNSLILLGSFLLFSGLSCPEECEVFSGIGVLEVVLQNPAESYLRGDTLWLNADFPAIQGEGVNQISISENGGLVVTQLFRIGADSSSVLPGLDAFTPVEDEGFILANRPEDDPAATLLRYTCPGGNCRFRQGFVVDSAGVYLLQVTGSTIDQVAGAFDFCGAPTLAVTRLEGGNNLSGVNLNYPLSYRFNQDQLFFSGVDTFQQNLFLIRAQ
jgi:hypothetical protein